LAEISLKRALEPYHIPLHPRSAMTVIALNFRPHTTYAVRTIGGISGPPALRGQTPAEVVAAKLPTIQFGYFSQTQRTSTAPS
jgi:hypothetical protein